MANDLSSIREKGYDALLKELGSYGMVLFMRQFESGSGNYTEEKEELLKNLSVEDIIKSVNERKLKNNKA